MNAAPTISDTADVSSGLAVPRFDTFAELADAAHLSSAGQALLRHVQRRIVASLEAAGFRVAAWASRPNPMSPLVRTVYESLKVVDPLNAEVFDIELQFRLKQFSWLTEWHLVASVRREGAGGGHLTGTEIVHESWKSVEFPDAYAHYQAAFLARVAPDGIADEVFSSLADNLSFEVAP